MELSEEGVPQWRSCFDEQCEARFESFKALATHVLRLHGPMEVVSRSVITNQCPVCLAVYGERKAAHRGACTALSSEAVQENRGQGRLDAHRVLPGPGDSLLRGSAGSGAAAAERGEGVRPRTKRPPRARSIEALNTDAREVERLSHRVEQYNKAGLLRRGVLEPSMVCASFMTKGGQQVPQAKSKAKARARRSQEMMNEGVEQIPDVSPPRPQPERPPTVFVRGPKSANITEKPTAEYWGPFARMTIFSSTWNRLHVFFICAEKLCVAFCGRMTRTYFLKKSSMAPVWMTHKDLKSICMAPVQGRDA